MKTDLTIVVVSFNSERFLRDCLTSLRQHRPTRHCAQIVVVDNGSRDASARIVAEEFPEVTLIKAGENLGFGRGNNLGMDAAPARWYYLHNVDAYLQENVLDPALDMLDADPSIGVAGLPLVFPDLSPQTGAYAFTTPTKWALQGLGVQKLAHFIATQQRLGWLRRLLSAFPIARSFLRTHSSDDGTPTGIVDVDWVCGAALLLSEQVRCGLGGGFDPEIFLYGEDEDLCIGARDLGWRIVQLPTTPVIHEFGWGSTGRTSPVVAQLKADSLTYFINKRFHRPGPAWAAMRVMLWIKRKAWGV